MFGMQLKNLPGIPRNRKIWLIQWKKKNQSIVTDPEETQMIKLVEKNDESFYNYLLNNKESRGKEESVRKRNEWYRKSYQIELVDIGRNFWCEKYIGWD